MSSSKDTTPELAAIVRAGDQQQEAEQIADGIFMAKDISNAYLLTTADGDVMVNTGFMDNAERTRRLFAPKRSGPLRYIVLTQAHADHYGGVPVLREPDTKIVAERRFMDTWQYFHDLAPYLQKRSAKLWASTMRRGSNPLPPPRVEPDVLVDRSYEFTVGGVDFEVISTPGGESRDSLTVWLPGRRVAFTGNLFGPVFLGVPNLVTVRGDKPRLVERYLSSLDTVRRLGAELLITGHGEPIRGAEVIRAALDKMYAAVSFLRSVVIDGMNAGADVHSLMRQVVLPEALQLRESHGKVSWVVRSIWEEYSGWFHYDSTTSLYGVPAASVSADLVQLAGGVAALATRAHEKLTEKRPLEALHLLDIALRVEPTHAEALGAKKAALEQLLEESRGQNLSEVMWLKSELAAIQAASSP